MSETAKVKYDPAKIEAAIKRAQAQVAGGDAKTEKAPKAEKPAKTPKAEKATKEKAEKPAKAEKAPKAEKPAKERGTAHLSKVEKAAVNLPALSDVAKAAFDRINEHPAGYSAGELTAIAAHLTHKARTMMTASAISVKPQVGDTIEVLPGGDRGTEKYVGMTGTLTEVRNIRCFANIEDADGNIVKKNLYLYTSGVRVIAADSAKEFPADPKADEKAEQVDSSPADDAADASEGTPSAAPEETEETPVEPAVEQAATGTDG